MFLLKVKHSQAVTAAVKGHKDSRVSRVSRGQMVYTGQEETKETPLKGTEVRVSRGILDLAVQRENQADLG